MSSSRQHHCSGPRPKIPAGLDAVPASRQLDVLRRHAHAMAAAVEAGTLPASSAGDASALLAAWEHLRTEHEHCRLTTRLVRAPRPPDAPGVPRPASRPPRPASAPCTGSAQPSRSAS